MHIYISTIQKSRTARSDKNTNSCPKTNPQQIEVMYFEGYSRPTCSKLSHTHTLVDENLKRRNCNKICNKNTNPISL